MTLFGARSQRALSAELQSKYANAFPNSLRGLRIEMHREQQAKHRRVSDREHNGHQDTHFPSRLSAARLDNEHPSPSTTLASAELTITVKRGGNAPL
jgi:hypothetical protein